MINKKNECVDKRKRKIYKKKKIDLLRQKKTKYFVNKRLKNERKKQSQKKQLKAIIIDRNYK